MDLLPKATRPTPAAAAQSTGSTPSISRLQLACAAASSSSSSAGARQQQQQQRRRPTPVPLVPLPPQQQVLDTSSSSSSLQRHCVITHAGFGGFGASKGAKGGNKPGVGNSDCPCGSGRRYSECCQIYHKTASAKPGPEALIRARYSAFVKRLPKYLKVTSHPDNPALRGSSTTLPDGTVKTCSYEEDLAVTFVSMEFLGLSVLGSSMAQDGSSATVDVQARVKRVVDAQGQRVSKPQEQVWTERATLLKDADGQWFVRDVQQLVPAGGEEEAAAAAAAVEAVAAETAAAGAETGAAT